MHVPQTEVILRFDGAELARVTLTPGEYVIGRSLDVHIYADTPLLSRKHAKLSIERDHIAIQDLGSSNGTFVDDQQITGSALVSPGQAVRLGDVQLVIEAAPAPPLGVPEELLAARPYAIGDQIARGGMGAILAAQQGALKRPVAMKVMLNDTDPDSVRRFVEEAQVTGQLTHPNIVPIHELGVDERGQVFYTMKMVRGITLKKVIELLGEGVEATKKKYPLPALLTIFQKACDAVAFAHAHGVIHRDLKPENIMLGDYGEVLVMDWGLAKRGARKDREGGNERPARSAPDSSSLPPARDRTLHPSALTLDGTIMGTPAYMAPEQARGEIEALDARSDIYALGAILFELLHLRPTVTGRSAMEIVDKVGRGEVAMPDRKRVPDSLAAVVLKAMELDQAARYRAVEDLQRDLTSYQNGFATSAENAGLGRQLLLALKRHKIAAAGVAAVLLVGASFGTKAVIEGRRAEKALAALRDTAPTFIAQAETQIAGNDLAGALKNATAAAQLAPEESGYHVFRAHLLLAQPNLIAATEEYRRALGLKPADPEAREHLNLCDELLRGESAGAKLSAGALHRLHSLMVKYGRASHAVYLLRESQGERKRLLETWRRVLEQGGIVLAENGLELLDNGTFRVRANFRTEDLSALHQMPLSELDVKDSKVVDLRPLAALKSLRRLNLDRSKVADLSPLQGLTLESLSINFTEVASLEPLKGMPLRELQMNRATRVQDFSALRGMPLELLYLDQTAFKEFDLLRHLPLRQLNLGGLAEMKDLAVLAGLPLEELLLAGCPNVRDLRPLRGMPLTRLQLTGSPVTDLTPLAGMSLRNLSIAGLKVGSIEPLRGMPLDQFLDISGMSLTDLSPLKDSKITSLRANTSVLTDLSGLARTPIKSLILSKVPGPLDLTPLLECPSLENLVLPTSHTNVEILRGHPKLQRLSSTVNAFAEPAQTVAEFWPEFDAKQNAPEAK